MKRLLFTILLFTAALPAAAQLYHPGEQLFYRVSYLSLIHISEPTRPY